MSSRVCGLLKPLRLPRATDCSSAGAGPEDILGAHKKMPKRAPAAVGAAMPSDPVGRGVLYPGFFGFNQGFVDKKEKKWGGFSRCCVAAGGWVGLLDCALVWGVQSGVAFGGVGVWGQMGVRGAWGGQINTTSQRPAAQRWQGIAAADRARGGKAVTRAARSQVQAAGVQVVEVWVLAGSLCGDALGGQVHHHLLHAQTDAGAGQGHRRLVSAGARRCGVRQQSGTRKCGGRALDDARERGVP